jgi:hypothetical protein
MRLLVYQPGNHGYAGGAKLFFSMAERKLLSIASVPRRPAFDAQLDVARDFREWVLLHEGAAKRRYWERISTRGAELFVGFGSAATFVASVLMPGMPKVAIVEQFDSERLANCIKQKAAGLDLRRLDLQTAYHRRIEIDLLRTFDRVIANPALVPILIEHRLTNVSSDIDEIEALLSARVAA